MARVTVTWKPGLTGSGTPYTFSPRPNLVRSGTLQKFVEFKIPQADGSQIQTLGNDSKVLSLTGVLYVKYSNYDNLDELRRGLLSGIGNTVGQLHITSNLGQGNSKHIYYVGLPTRIDFNEQTNSQILDYAIDILLNDPVEHIV